jgi:hypothetical protein
LITDVFRSRPLLCTIHHPSNCTLARVENVAVVPAVLDKGYQSKPSPGSKIVGSEMGQQVADGSGRALS